GLTGEHLLGAWLLDTAGWAGSRSYTGGPVVETSRTAVLVMADGSAKHDHAAPGYFDTRAAEFDTAIARSLRDGAADELADVDAHRAAELWSNSAARCASTSASSSAAPSRSERAIDAH